MKRLLLACLGMGLTFQMAIAQKCGMEPLENAIVAHNPSFKEQMAAQKASLKDIVAAYKMARPKGAKETSSYVTVPVVFHFVIDSAQLIEIGGTAGIEQRLDSQIAVLNRDYNRENADSISIPDGFKPSYAYVGIRFGLAHTSPTGTATPGYELKITSSSGFCCSGDSYSDAKSSASGGLDSWDVTQYINVWCLNPTDLSSLVGITVPHSFVGSGSGMTTANVGVCLRYNAVGKRRLASDSYPGGIDLGRTLTHEMGHYFEIWHPWGDDGGLCPWDGGEDDGMADTPPEADAQYGDPTYPQYDGCKMDGLTDEQPHGVMFMNYMDYPNDDALHMFTIDQAAAMNSQVQPGKYCYTVTLHPELLNYPESVSRVEVNNNLDIYPNPSTGVINISRDITQDSLHDILVYNMVGQIIMHIKTDGNQQNIYTVNLSGLGKGIYFVTCNFVSGSVTRKIVLQ